MVFPILKTPGIKSRPRKHLYACLFLAILSPGVLNAAPLTEQQSLDLGMQHTGFTKLLEGYQTSASATISSIRAWQNPSFQISREEAGNETETSFMLHQTLDFSGERSLKIQSSQKKLEATTHNNQRLRKERSADIQRQFYQTLYWQLHQQTLRHWLDKFIAVEKTMKTREAAGDVSGYDLRRISQERITLLTQHDEINAELVAAWELLYGYFPANTSFDSIDGKLLPEAPAPINQLIESLDLNPELLSRQQMVEAARLSGQSIKRGRIPDITLGLGHKSISSPGEDASGLMFSASMPLPLFNRKQGELTKALADLEIQQQQFLLTRQQKLALIKSHWQKASQFLNNANSFSKRTENTAELVNIAEAAYQADELGVLELIDAYRSNLQTDIRALQLALQARLSKIDLDQTSSGDTK